MSRAFVTDKEDWIYCPKAGERCMHAEEGKPCGETKCEFFAKEAKAPSRASSSVRIVKRKAKDAKASNTQQTARASHAPQAQPARKTRKSTLPKPKKWGGRSGSNI